MHISRTCVLPQGVEDATDYTGLASGLYVEVVRCNCLCEQDYIPLPLPIYLY